MEKVERELISAVESAGFDAEFFMYALRVSVDMQKAERKTDTQIRYNAYRHWARELKRQDVGMEGTSQPYYEYPREATEFLRRLTGGPAKRENKKVKVMVPMVTLCHALAVPPRK